MATLVHVQVFLMFMRASSYSPVRTTSVCTSACWPCNRNTDSSHLLPQVCIVGWFLTQWILRMSQRQCAVMKPACWDCCMSRKMYSTERLSYYIILWTDFSPLGGDLSFACHGRRIQSAAASGGLWQICRALGDNSWSCLSALHHSLWKSVKGMHMAFISTDTSTGTGLV